MATSNAKKAAALRKAQKAAHTPEANAKRAASIRAFYAKRKALVPIDTIDGPAPVIQYEGDKVRRAYRKIRDATLPNDREEMIKAHLAIMLKLLHGK